MKVPTELCTGHAIVLLVSKQCDVLSLLLSNAAGEIVALKQVKLPAHLTREGFPITALRETNVLLSLRHPSIVRVREMVVGAHMDNVRGCGWVDVQWVTCV
jgi:hypothetical protein